MIAPLTVIALLKAILSSVDNFAHCTRFINSTNRRNGITPKYSFTDYFMFKLYSLTMTSELSMVRQMSCAGPPRAVGNESDCETNKTNEPPHDKTNKMDAKADLSLHWAHRSFCWFCHEAAQIYFIAHERGMKCYHYFISSTRMRKCADVLAAG